MDIVALHRQGLSNRQIARQLGVHRMTVSRYLAAGGERRPYDTSGRTAALAPYLARIRAFLEEDAYQGTWIFRRLKAMGYAGGLRAVQRAVAKLRGPLVRKAFLRFETEPGQQAQVDFAEMTILDEGGEKIERLSLFVMILGFSRKCYAELMGRPELSAFLEAHQRAFECFGGIPVELLYDQTKHVVIRHRGREPQWNDTFSSFAQHCGFAPRLCPPYASWVKGKVERPIHFIREGFWRGYRYDGHLDDANRDLLSWLIEQEARMHGTTRQRVDERFGLERPHLGPLPRSAFDTSARYVRTVGKDCLVYFGHNRYRVPHRAVGKRVLLRVKAGRIRLFDDGELLAAYAIPEGTGHLVSDPALERALREDAEQTRMKYRMPLGRRRKGAARTIGLMEAPLSVAVQVRDIAEYAALAGGFGHE